MIVAANRDEFYARPTSPAAHWADHPEVFAGRDLEKGGTWLGVTTNGRFAALTNFRDPSSRKTNPKSRGQLVSRFLASQINSAEFLANIEREANEYDDFNIIVGDRQALHYFSSRNEGPKQLSSGFYGISNELLDTPWPKLMQAKAKFQDIINKAQPASPDSLQEPSQKRIEPFDSESNIGLREALFKLLADRSASADHELPNTGVGLEWERKLSPIFIASAGYGTRASTIVLFHRDGQIYFHERSFGEEGQFLTEVKETLPSPK